MTGTTNRTRSSSFHDSISPQLNQNFQPEENWIDRPVRVFHVRHGKQADSDRFILVGKSKEPERTRLFSGMKMLGFSPMDVLGLQEDSRIDTFAWPRNMEWKTLPSVSEPAFKLLYGHYTVFDEVGSSHHVEAGYIKNAIKDSIATAATKLLVVSAKDLNERVLASIAHLIQATPDLQIMHFDGVKLHSVPNDMLDAAADKYNADARFVFNHVVNTIIMTSRAFLKLARQDARSQIYVELFTPRLDDHHWRLGHPLSLQALFAIRKLGRLDGDETHLASLAQDDSLPWLMTHTLPFFETTEDGDYFSWKGSGRYPEWRIPLGKVAPGTVKDRRGVHVSPHHIFWLLKSLVKAGYVGVYSDQVRITTRGETFLDLIGNEAEDPDVLLRWRDNDLLGRPEHVPQMDRWLNRAFRSIKRRVSSLPASPVTEQVETPWPIAAKNRLYVFGHRIDFSQAELLKNNVKALLAQAEEHEKNHELVDRKFGVVRQGLGFGDPLLPVGVWIGTPVAVLTDSGQKLAEIDLFADWKQFRDTYDNITFQLPSWARENQTPNLIEATATADAPVELNIPARHDGTYSRNADGRVYLGHVLELGDLAKCHAELSEYATLQSITRGFSTITDGVHTFGSGKRITMVYGMLAGYHNAATDRIVIQANISPARTTRVENRLKHWRRDTPLVFDHPEFTEFGYWLVSPSGMVEALNTADSEDRRIIRI